MCADAAYELLPDGPAPPTRLPMALVVFDPPADEGGARIDWSDWYLTDEEDEGQNPDQGDFIRSVTSSMRMLANERSWKSVRVASDEFFAWVQGEPLVRVSPDVFVMNAPPPKPYPKVWETWKPGVSPPRFALEIVSEDWKKDYDDNPPKYAQLGTSELVIFDPKAASGQTSNPRRVPLQVYRREADGAFVRVRLPADARIALSEELGAWLVVLGEGFDISLRIARDPEGLDLVPTKDEALVEAERLRSEEQRARLEAERGLVEERARLINRLERRFGPLESEQRRRLQALDMETLLNGLLDAESLDELMSQ
jgi:Uma2 family endonuclease